MEEAGFEIVERSDTGRITFRNPKTKAEVYDDRYDKNPNTGKLEKNWHIRDGSNQRYDQHGKPVSKGDPSAHIAAE